MNIPLLIIPFLLNSLATTTSGNKIGISPNISADEIACNYCWISEYERSPKVFKSSHIVKCDKNKVVIKKKSEYRCVVNLVYDSWIDMNWNTDNLYKFALTATKKTNCKYSDTLCASDLYSCGQSYICCDENFCNSPDNINFHTSTYIMGDDNEILSQCLSMSFKDKKVKATKNLVTAKEPIKLLKTNYCDSAGTTNTKPQIVLLIGTLIFYLGNLWN